MKFIRNFSPVVLGCIVAAACLRAKAEPLYWLSVETEAYDGDSSEGGNVGSYAMYYCTVDSASKLFGGSSVYAIESYMENHFAEVLGKAVTYDSVAYSDGEYHILDYADAAFGSADYVALAFYGNDAYRVYGFGSALLTPYGQVAFNGSQAASGTVGDWRQLSVPEPSCGLLLLVGLAGLALKRRRAFW